MHSHCFQSFGTNEISAKEEKRFGIYENVSCNICVVLSGHTVMLAAGNCQKQLEFLLVCVLFTLRARLNPLRLMSDAGTVQKKSFCCCRLQEKMEATKFSTIIPHHVYLFGAPKTSSKCKF